MTSIPVRDQHGAHLTRWTVDGTTLEVATNSTDEDATRTSMRRDLEESRASGSSLLCYHLSDPFDVRRGTYLLGRGWKLHTPDSSRLSEMMDLAQQACQVSWTQLPAVSVDQPL